MEKLRTVAARWYAQSPLFSEKCYRRGLVRLLREELKRKPNYKILEIGSLRGESAKVWAKLCEEANNGSVTCVDWWKNPEDLQAFQKNTREFGTRIIPMPGTVPEMWDTLTASFDFIFLDINASYAMVRNNILRADRILSEGGILCGDDMELIADHVDRTVMEANKEKETIQDPLTGIVYHPSVTAAVGELLGIPLKDRVFWAFRKNSGWKPIALQ